MVVQTVALFGNPSDPAVRSTLSYLCQSQYSVRHLVPHDCTCVEGAVSRVNPDTPETFTSALSGIDAIVVFTETIFGHPSVELSYGKALARACASECVGHVIYSTQINVLKTIGVGAQHMDTKVRLETFCEQRICLLDNT